MRDAFGGSFMLKLFLVFIFIYIGFTAIALNYAKAFKVKDKVISYIETNEITDFINMPSSVRDAMEEYFETEILGKDNYRATISCTGDDVVYCQDGIKITKEGEAQNTEGVYYKVTTTVGWSIPFINKLLQISGATGDVTTGLWNISGETRLIVGKIVEKEGD